MQLLKGRWGPFLKVGKNNFKLPKDVEPEELTYEDCLKIMAEAPDKKSKSSAKGGAKAKAKPRAKAKPAAKKTKKKK